MQKELQVNGATIFKNSSINIVGYILPAIFLLFATPYIVRGFGNERYAVLSLSWVLIGYFTVFDLGLGTATTKFVAEALGKGKREEIPTLVWSAISAQLILGLLASILLISLVPLFTGKIFSIPHELINDARKAFYISAFFIPVAFISNSFTGILAAIQRFDLVNIVKIPSQLSIYLAGILGVYFNLAIADVVWIILLSRITILSLLVYVCVNIFPNLTKPAFSMDIFKKISTFGGWLTLSNSINPLMFYVDRFLIGSLLGMTALTFYTVPFDLAARVWFISTSLTMTLFPAFSALAAEKNHEQAAGILFKSIKYLILISGPVVCVMTAYSSDLFNLWIGPQFREQSAPVLQVLLISTLFDYPQIISSTFLEGVGRPNSLAKIKLVYLPIHILICYLLLIYFGIVGAALAIFLIRIIYSTTFTFAALRVLKIPIKTLFNKLFFSYLVIACFLGFSLVVDSVTLWLRSAEFAVFLVCYVVVVWRYILDAEEKITALSLMKSLFAQAHIFSTKQH